MDNETFNKIKKKNVKAISALFDEQLKRSWFVCRCICENTEIAAPMLVSAWENAIDKISASSSPPPQSFRQIIYSEILLLSQNFPPADDSFEDAAAPDVGLKFKHFEEEALAVRPSRRAIYLVNVYGGLGKLHISELLKIDEDEVQRALDDSQRDIDGFNAHGKKGGAAQRLKLFTEFKNPSGNGFDNIEIPDLILKKLNKTLFKSANTYRNSSTGKDKLNMAKNTSNPKTSAADSSKQKSATVPERRQLKKKSKTKIFIISGAAVIAVVLALVFILPNMIRAASASSGSTTTYKVEAVTYGDVDTTVSGSGTLTPVTEQTLSKNYPVTVTELNYSVGDEIEKGETIAKVENSDGDPESITAPYDCILIEQPVAVDDEVADQGEIAMIMGEDGFTMSVSVDELNITSIKVGQDVTFSLDALDDEQTGTVTAVSYNGKTSGSSATYQITAKLDYVEGVYPGMSATAEIVIESSGEGLLVPVEAVKTSGDDNYIYVAPSDAEEGGEYSESELSLDSLEKINVDTGTSDGTYIMIETDDLAEGDLIIVESVTSNQTGSSDSSGGGDFSGFGGDFSGGDFDASNFDPGNMPQGGGNFPGNDSN